MGERRKRRSLWDKEAEAPHFSGTSENNYWTGKERHSSHDSGQYHEFSGSESFRAPNFRDKSRQPSLEYIEEDPVAPMSGRFNRSREYPPERKELGGENKYYQRMSPEFKYSHSLGNDQSHSQRYPGRGRSRSRSRSRSRGRSRSRSLSRGREKERVRVRSRSRSRDDDMARGQRSWRSRPDHGHISRHSYSSRGSRSELRDDVSDPYQGEDEQFQNRSRGAVPCKDFIKGNCRWGDTCRFSHHFASEETSGRGTRYSSSDKDGEQQPYRSGMPLCKYFAAGKCDRNNCRFSHEDSRFNSLEGRERKVSDDDSFRNKGNKREREPTWMDTTRITDNVKRSGWNESIITVTNNHSDNTNERNGNRWGHSLGNENVNQGIRERADNLIDRNNLPSPPARSGSYGGDLGISGSINEEIMANKQEVLMLPDSQLQIQDGNLKAQGPNILEVDQQFSVEALQNVSQISHIQQQGYGVVENNPMSSFRSDVFDEVKDFRSGVDPISLSGQNLSQNGENVFPGHSSLPMKADSGQNIPYPNPADLVANLKLLSQVHNHRNAIQMAGMLETRVPQLFPDLATSEHSAPFTNSLVPVPGQQGALVETDYMNFNPVSISHDPVNPMENDRGTNEQKNHTEQGNQMQAERLSPFSIAGVEPDKSKVDHSERSKLKEETVLANSEVGEEKGAIGEESKGIQNNKNSETLEGPGKAEESNANKDEKGMRLFKIALVEFVKDILKPTWKEGRMSREVHKTIVKKVVDKVISTIQVDHIPKTQEKAEQYLSFSKPKIAKLVQAYVGRSLKSDS